MTQKISKVLLIYPPRTILKSSAKRCPTPIGLAYIAAVLERSGSDVEILDAAVEGYENERHHGEYMTYGLSYDEIKKRMEESSPQLVGVTCPFSSEIKKVKEISKLAKDVDNNIIVVVGGLHPSTYPKETLEEKSIDFVVMGEGEYRLLDLINSLNEESRLESIDGLAFRENDTIKINPPSTKIENLDELPFPARHLLKMEKYLDINIHISPYSSKNHVEQILTSRGCPGRCIFCSSSRYWGHGFRARSPENVLEEMEFLVEKYGIEEFQFTDDNLTWDKKRAMDIFTLMKERLSVVWAAANGIMVNTLSQEMLRLMKASGCYQLTYAIESGNEEVLHKIMKKPIKLERVGPLVREAKKLEISLHATFVLGLPGETREQIKDTFRFAKSMGFDSVSFFIASPIPGSELFDVCKERGLFKDDFSFADLDFKTSSIELAQVSNEEIERLIARQNFYFIVRYTLTNPVKAWKKYSQFVRRNPSQFLKIFGRVT